MPLTEVETYPLRVPKLELLNWSDPVKTPVAIKVLVATGNNPAQPKSHVKEKLRHGALVVNPATKDRRPEEMWARCPPAAAA
jgi:hypothetical protein